MYKVGEDVLYGSNGVCTITEITNKKIAGKTIEYYVLKPVYSETSTLFVPVHNEALVSKIRSVLSKDELNSILSNLPDPPEWNDNKNDRLELFKNVISEGNCLKLITLIRLIHNHEQIQVSKGKRLHISDERILKEAEKMVCDEISLVLQVDRSRALELIIN